MHKVIENPVITVLVAVSEFDISPLFHESVSLVVLLSSSFSSSVLLN